MRIFLHRNLKKSKKSGMGGGAFTRCDIDIVRETVCQFAGEVEILLNGKVIKKHNTILTALLNASAQGAAVGTFDAINSMQFMAAGPTILDTVAATKVAGGTGAEDYITFQGVYTNGSGVSKTVTDLRLGHSILVGTIYATSDITDTIVPNGDTLTINWKITFSLVPGDMQPQYRYNVVKMLDSGLFDVPDKMDFVEAAVSNTEVATLEGGGTGAEAYHQWVSEFTASSAVTIIQVELYHTAVDDYTVSDLTDKSLSIGEKLTVHTKLTHSAAQG